MSEQPLNLTEVRSTLRQLITWAGAVQRLKEVLDNGAELESRIGAYERQTLNVEQKYETAVKRYEQEIADFKKRSGEEAVALEKDQATHAALKAQLEADLTKLRETYAVAKQELVTNHAHLAAALKAEHAKLLQDVEAVQVAHKVEMAAFQKERAAAQQDLQTLLDERRRVLQRFSL